MESLNNTFRKLEFANELGNNEKFIHRFSDPDGVRSGKSGWSFGVCQFDTQNNEQALECLRECGFSEAEIQGIVKQTIDVKPLSARLAAHAEIIARYDTAQLSRCLNSALNVIAANGVPIENPGGILACADYVNQYGSIGSGFVAWMKELDREVTAKDVLTFKLEKTKYGREHPADCKRRYDNLVKLLASEAP